MRVEQLPEGERIVDQDQPPRADDAQGLLEVEGITGLVGVDEHRVGRVVRERGQHCGAGAEQHLDGGLWRRAGDPLAREGGVVRRDLDRSHAPAGSERARHDERRIAGERAHFDDFTSAGGAQQDLQQTRLFRGDPNRGNPGRTSRVLELAQERVLSFAVRTDVVEVRRADRSGFVGHVGERTGRAAATPASHLRNSICAARSHLACAAASGGLIGRRRRMATVARPDGGLTRPS
jgi:hypothetical protein